MSAVTKRRAKAASEVEIDYREAFRDQVVMMRDDSGEFVYRGQARHLLNIIAGYVKPANGEFFLTLQRASDALGVKLRDRGRGPAAELFARFRQDGILEVLERGHGETQTTNGASRATTYRVVLPRPTPAQRGGSPTPAQRGGSSGTYPPNGGDLPPQQGGTYPRTARGVSSSTECQRSGTTLRDVAPPGGSAPRSAPAEETRAENTTPCALCGEVHPEPWWALPADDPRSNPRVCVAEGCESLAAARDMTWCAEHTDAIEDGTLTDFNAYRPPGQERWEQCGWCKDTFVRVCAYDDRCPDCEEAD